MTHKPRGPLEPHELSAMKGQDAIDGRVVRALDDALRAALARAEEAEAKLKDQLPRNIHDQKQYEALRSDLDAVRTDRDQTREESQRRGVEISSLRTENEKLGAALGWYANKANWIAGTSREPAKIADSKGDTELLEPHEDYFGWFGGRRAREALNPKEKA